MRRLVKDQGPTAKRVEARHRKLVKAEHEAKAEVRQREGHRCRFPFCPCKARGGEHGEVAHLDGKGMGGDPTGVRSVPENMLLLCHERHQGKFSLHKQNLRFIPNDRRRGANGTGVWQYKHDRSWRFLAQERFDAHRRIVFDPTPELQARVLEVLTLKGVA